MAKRYLQRLSQIESLKPTWKANLNFPENQLRLIKSGELDEKDQILFLKKYCSILQPRKKVPSEKVPRKLNMQHPRPPKMHNSAWKLEIN